MLSWIATPAEDARMSEFHRIFDAAYNSTKATTGESNIKQRSFDIMV
jgi:hypothetical protein